LIFRGYRPALAYLLLLLVVLGLNTVSASGINFWALCFVPICLATWNLGGKTGSLFVAIAALALAVQAFNTGLYPTRAHLLVSVASKTLAFALVTWLVVRLRVQEIGRLIVPSQRRAAKKQDGVR
jgi:hypothetical protein